MAHRVDVTMTSYEITRRGSAIELVVYNDDEKLGEIQIGKGSFGWKNAREQDFQSKTWTELFRILNGSLSED